MGAPPNLFFGCVGFPSERRAFLSLQKFKEAQLKGYDNQDEIKIELKYCERCGGLWLRRVGDPQVYCAPCAPAMEQTAITKKAAARERWDRVMQDLGGVACA